MSRAITGVYSLPGGNPVQTGTPITTNWANTTLTDIETALTDSLSRSGYGSMSGTLKLADGSSTFPALTVATDISSGFYVAGVYDFRFVCQASDLQKWTLTGVSIYRTLTVTTSTSNSAGVVATGNGTGAGVTGTGGTSPGVGGAFTGGAAAAGNTAGGTGVTGLGGAPAGSGAAGIGGVFTGYGPGSATGGTGATITGGAPTASGAGGTGATVTGGGSASGAGGTGLVVAGGAPSGGNGAGGTGATIAGGTPNGTGAPGVGLTVTGANAASGNTNGAQALTVTGGNATGTGTGGRGALFTGGQSPSGNGGVGASFAGGAPSAGSGNGGNGITAVGGAPGPSGGAGGNAAVFTAGVSATATTKQDAVWLTNGYLTFGSTVGPNNSVAMNNELTPKNTPKGWAKVSTSGTGSVTVSDGFNLTAAISGSAVRFTFPSGGTMASTNYVVHITGTDEGSLYYVTSKTTSTFDVFSYIYALNGGGTAVVTQGTSLSTNVRSFDVLVHGPQ